MNLHRNPLNFLLVAVLAAALCTAVSSAADNVYFHDDFSGGGDRAFYVGTLDARSFQYIDGKYEIDTMDGASYGQSVLMENLGTYRVEVTGRMVESEDPQEAGFGLSFNYNQREGGSDFILLLVYDRGAFTVLRYLDGRTSVLYTPAKTKLFNSGEEVNLTVDAANGHFTCYINGGQVCELTDDRLDRGGFGVFATAGSIVHFDDFTVFAETAPVDTGFTDDFNSEQQLYTGNLYDVDYRYEAGSYIIDTTETDLIGLSPFPEQALNFEFVVDAELLAGDALGGYGIYLRDFPDDSGGFNQYRFLISRDWFAVEQSIDDMPLALAEWVQHRAVKTGDVNRLRVRAEGTELTFFVNGLEVYRHTDQNPHRGSFGFFTSGRSRVAFDNVEFRRL